MSNCFPLLAIFNFSNLDSASSATAEQASWILIRTPIAEKDNKQVWRAGSHSQSLSDRRQRLKCKGGLRRLGGSCNFSLWISSECHLLTKNTG